MNTLFLKGIDQQFGSLLIRLLPRFKNTRREFPAAPSFLFIRPGGIGDAILLIPAIQAIKSAFPDCHIEILAETRNGAVFTLCSAVEKVYRHDHFMELFSCLTKRYDCIIDTEQHHRLSAVVSRVIRSDVKIGFSGNERVKMFSDCVDYSHDTYEADSFLNLLAPLGITPPEKISKPFLQLPESAKQTVQRLLTPLQSETYICIFPGASIQERQWGEDNFFRLTQLFNQKGFQVVVIGGKEDIDTGNEIVKGNKGTNLAGKTTFAESFAIIQNSHLLISGDSGMLHAGVALNKATVSLFGSGIAAKWAPHGDKHIIINKQLSCSPCTRFGYTPKCPNNAACMQQITVQEVFAAAMSLINKRTE
ncbi:ADP-heptose:LPS heptosyltransferase [Desulfocapsa sulfexigens DSM 10523]|uniref:ADP-heptose:LPS heptosyltransferase n=1 Tax=Desulfocapsa sulfexigens (strain DSM 10523 / SB164P1) TaxID=1167006 RepID=M1P5M2_DESSD|nr:glycosyltransferase family 9 protein [Desulfocapsa sulfexigens]AGF78793.1 ADP-heptose:LPS heptosyltransferase [Desulfocapsa sulfexigens DSM 10523]